MAVIRCSTRVSARGRRIEEGGFGKGVGLDDAAQALRGMRIAQAELLRKPFRINDLATSIERALRAAAEPPDGNVVPLRSGRRAG